MSRTTITSRIHAAGLEIVPAAHGKVAIVAQTAHAHSAQVQRHPCAGRSYANERAAKAAFTAAERA